MPETHFEIKWPDGSQQTCYSPSLIVKDYFTSGQAYELKDFLERSRTALHLAIAFRLNMGCPVVEP